MSATVIPAAVGYSVVWFSEPRDTWHIREILEFLDASCVFVAPVIAWRVEQDDVEPVTWADGGDSANTWRGLETPSGEIVGEGGDTWPNRDAFTEAFRQDLKDRLRLADLEKHDTAAAEASP